MDISRWLVSGKHFFESFGRLWGVSRGAFLAFFSVTGGGFLFGLEFFNTTLNVNKSHFTSEERVAGGADFYFDFGKS